MLLLLCMPRMLTRHVANETHNDYDYALIIIAIIIIRIIVIARVLVTSLWSVVELLTCQLDSMLELQLPNYQ